MGERKAGTHKVDVDGINDDDDDISRDAQQRNETSKTGAVVMRNASITKSSPVPGQMGICSVDGV